MKGLITTIKVERRFFTSLEKIGDVLQYRGKTCLILGIEKFKIYSQSMFIWYTVQYLENQDYQEVYTGYAKPDYLPLVVKMKYDDARFANIEMGRVLAHKEDGHMYKVMEFVDIAIDGTDVVVSFLGMKMTPVSRKEAKEKLFQARQKQLNLEIV